MAGMANIRDFAMPPPGFYAVVYNALYFSSTIKDRNGNSVNSINVDGADVPVDIDVSVYGLAPALIWITHTGLWDIDYSALIMPTFGNTSVGAAIGAGDNGLSVDESQFNVGDLYFQPLWLGKHFEQFDVGLSYGFYAPVGKYSVNAVDNVGLGFWGHQLQMAGYYYPFPTKATAIQLLTTFEFNQQKRNTNITPGSMFYLEVGAGQYLSERFEVGVSWASSFQISDDKNGVTAANIGKEQVHGAGIQLGYWILKNKLNLTGRYMGQFLAKSTLQGHIAAFNLSWII
jgi:hypothetical protein